MTNEEKNETVIDLDHHRTEGVQVFAGRNRGKAVRRYARIDELDSDDEPVLVRVPDDTFAVTSSFILGLFGDSIAKIGEEKFREKYRFEGPSIEIIYDAIRYASRVVNPLQKRD